MGIILLSLNPKHVTSTNTTQKRRKQVDSVLFNWFDLNPALTIVLKSGQKQSNPTLLPGCLKWVEEV